MIKALAFAIDTRLGAFEHMCININGNPVNIDMPDI